METSRLALHSRFLGHPSYQEACALNMAEKSMNVFYLDLRLEVVLLLFYKMHILRFDSPRQHAVIYVAGLSNIILLLKRLKNYS